MMEDKERFIMLSDRITALFTLLGCNNTDIARYAGCSSGNISKLKTGNRIPKHGSRSIRVLAEGVYGYADYENMLPALKKLCGSSGSSRESIIPALIAWLYGTDEIVLPEYSEAPKSKRTKTLRLQTFGDRLDRAVTLLEMSNNQLSRLLNIDVSLVSRYRSGIYSPHRNVCLSEKLSDVLFARAERIGKKAELAALCSADAEHFDADAVAAWLYDVSLEEDSAAIAQTLFRSLDEFTPGKGLDSTLVKSLETSDDETLYYGTEGLRNAVVRFLEEAVREGGELLLYSDEPMDWMTGDREYFALWASLMAKCVNNGVRIRIIHNVDRVGTEMIDAIRGWFPLYISGMIEPYVFRKVRNSRFHHTVFLRKGGACIHGFFPAAESDDRWYEYITDRKRLDILRRGYGSMLSAASPLLKVYNSSESADYHAYCAEKKGTRTFLLSGFPVFTMPEELLEQILDRVKMEETIKSNVRELCRRQRKQFRDLLSKDSVEMIISPAGDAAQKNIKVNFALELMELSVDYTKEEYSKHVAAVMDLVKNERNFHLTLLPEQPFKDIQIAMPGDAVSVLRCKEPYAAFVFLNPALTKSVSDYFSMLIGSYASDRHTTLELLDKLRQASAR